MKNYSDEKPVASLDTWSFCCKKHECNAKNLV